MLAGESSLTATTSLSSDGPRASGQDFRVVLYGGPWPSASGPLRTTLGLRTRASYARRSEASPREVILHE